MNNEQLLEYVLWYHNYLITIMFNSFSINRSVIRRFHYRLSVMWVLCAKNVLLVCYVDQFKKRLNNNVYKYDLPGQIKSMLLLLLEWYVILCENYGGIAQPNNSNVI